MKRKLTFVILMLTAISVSGYADDAPVLATAGFVRDAYNQINAKKQDKLPMASRPTSGRYNVVWDGDAGQFVFNIDTESGVICGPGGYIDGNVCSFCDKSLFDTTQTESISNGTRSRSDTCTSVNASGMTCECLDHIYGDWNYACNNGYRFNGIGCVNNLQCDAGKYDIGFEQCINPNTAGIANGGGYDAAAMTWYVDFDYGRVSGVASCTPNIGTYAVAYPDRYYDQTVTGKYCYCKMTDPVASAWVYRDLYGSTSDCSADCAHYCRNYVRALADFRAGIFGSVSM